MEPICPSHPLVVMANDLFPSSEETGNHDLLLERVVDPTRHEEMVGYPSHLLGMGACPGHLERTGVGLFHHREMEVCPSHPLEMVADLSHLLEKEVCHLLEMVFLPSFRYLLVLPRHFLCPVILLFHPL